MMVNLSIETSAHPTRESLAGLPATSPHAQAYNMAKLISQLEQDPKYNLQPSGLVVGSFPLDPENARDLDVEIRGVSFEHLQEQFRSLAGTNGIAEVTLTELDEDGTVTVGNAFVAVWLKMEGGAKMNLSVPTTVGPGTVRYDFNTVNTDPTLSLVESSRRRSFAHKALAYDPLTGRNGEVHDPHAGKQKLQNGVLTILQPDSFAADPLGLYIAVQECGALRMQPDKESYAVLRQMAADDLPVVPTTSFQPNRFAAELSKLLTSDVSPSSLLTLCKDFESLERDIPELHQLLQDHGEVAFLSVVTEVNTAWIVAKGEGSWTPKDKLAFTLARLGHEIHVRSQGEIPASGVFGHFYHELEDMTREDLQLATEAFLAVLEED